MAGDAEVTMFMYMGLLPSEEAVLKPMESAVVEILHLASIFERPFWGIDESGKRVLRVQSRVLVELDPDEVSKLTQEELISRLRRNITQG